MLSPKFRNCSSVIVRGSISGVLKGLLVVFEQEWGKVTSKVYYTLKMYYFIYIHKFARWRRK
ncbi:hypothetical protein K469DRAFT_802069 [Zopfia rhizophila CBS 207.26]|uniref:Uncharacterized protein n=1 Tax=Zopfia rhizophila CBS 207.26 TaxID=1314779 RepID=A0A6A6DLY8_9PEZI|nr:hypothetical protein K469DRAFT_802069 [Zopfia rhizophila CBS 207.26]